MNHQEWLDARRKGIGGSDAGAILGVNKYKTPLDVYLDNTGQAPDIEDNDAMYWGRALEDIVAYEYAKRTGKKVRRNNAILVHPEHKFMLANLDREIVGEPGILEIKTAARADDWGEPGSDEVPESYLAQVMHYMAVTGAQFADIAVLIAGRKFQTYTIQRDDQLIEHMIDVERDFWENNVYRLVPPDAKTMADLNNRWRVDSGAALVASVELHQKIKFLQALRDKEKQIQEERKELEFMIKEEMAEMSEILDDQGNRLVTWKARQSKRFDTKKFRENHADLADQYTVESTSRTFLLK
jgi:putative phage-type endonuclease